MKKLLLGLVLSAVVVTSLPTPVDAAEPGEWVRLELACANGKGKAVLGYSPTHPWWMAERDEYDSGIRNPNGWRSYYRNPCKGQWLLFSTWGGDPSEGSTTFWSIGTGKSGRVGGATSARLADAPICHADTSDAVVVAKPKQLREACGGG